MTDEEREHLERDFYSYIMRRMPNISSFWYGNLLDAFQMGFEVIRSKLSRLEKENAELKEREIKSEMFPKIILPKGSSEFIDKIIADAEKRIKESE